MATNEKLGRDIKFKVDVSGTDEEVGDVISADLSVENSLVEIINDSSGKFTERKKVRGDWNISLSLHLTEDDSASNQSVLSEAAFSDSGEITFTLEPETPETDDVTYSGTGVISSFNISKETDSVLEASFEISGNGELVRSVTV